MTCRGGSVVKKIKIYHLKQFYKQWLFKERKNIFK